jgi:hypothetical protein
MANQDSKIVFRDYPIVTWIFGAAMIVFGLTLLPDLFHGADLLNSLFTIILLIVGVAFLLLSSISTVTADSNNQLLTIASRSMIKNKKQEIPFSQIASIELEMSPSSSRSSSGQGSSTYRITATRHDGKRIPFRSTFTSGYMGKMKKVEQLRSIIGVKGTDQGIQSAFQQTSQMAQEVYQNQQEALTGSEAAEHVTDGIRWHLQTKIVGAQPFTRWFSTDFRMQDGFLFISQKPSGAGQGILSGLSKMLFRQSLSLYGFGTEDTPNLDGADTLQPFDNRFDNDFTAYTGNLADARQILNPWVIAALADWAYRFPLKRIQTNRVMGQITVMFSPSGVYVSSMGTMIPEAVDELAKLGVALVKAQGTSVLS